MVIILSTIPDYKKPNLSRKTVKKYKHLVVFKRACSYCRSCLFTKQIYHMEFEAHSSISSVSLWYFGLSSLWGGIWTQLCQFL